MGDSETGMAFARPAIHRRGLEADLAVVARLAAGEEAAGVVLGLPLNMDGSEGAQAAAAREFGERLAARGLAVEYEDERLTSWEAGEQLGGRADRRSGVLDSTAARLILQQYLDARRKPEPPADPPQETE